MNLKDDHEPGSLCERGFVSDGEPQMRQKKTVDGMELCKTLIGSYVLARKSGKPAYFVADNVTGVILFASRRAALDFKQAIVPVEDFDKWEVDELGAGIYVKELSCLANVGGHQYPDCVPHVILCEQVGQYLAVPIHGELLAALMEE